MPDIVVVGGMNMDVKAKTDGVHRPETSNPGRISFTPGGVGRNIAHNLAVLGHEVMLLSCVGDDAQGRELCQLTDQVGVDVSAVKTSHLPTGHYSVVVDAGGELVTAVSDMRVLDALTPDYVAQHERTLADAQFVVADCNLPRNTLQHLAERYGDKLVVDPVSVEKSTKLKTVLSQQSILGATPNQLQVEHLAQTNDPTEAARRLHAWGIRNVVIHLGKAGAVVSNADGVDLVAARLPERIVDVTGAGDAAIAGLLHGLILDKSWLEAAQLGQAMAARVIASPLSTLE